MEKGQYYKWHGYGKCRLLQVGNALDGLGDAGMLITPVLARLAPQLLVQLDYGQVYI